MSLLGFEEVGKSAFAPPGMAFQTRLADIPSLKDVLVSTVEPAIECHMTSTRDGRDNQVVGSNTIYGTEQTESGSTIETVETTGVTDKVCTSWHVETDVRRPTTRVVREGIFEFSRNPT